MTLQDSVKRSIYKYFEENKLEKCALQFQSTRKEFKGEITLVTFPLAKVMGKKPEEVGGVLGDYLANNNQHVAGYNVVKGFLNLETEDEFWLEYLNDLHEEEYLGVKEPETPKEFLVEYSSPNTNKPLHLGHLRNNFLGYSVAEILNYAGHKVHKVQIINDRGIHICKSMVAWRNFGDGETPESSGLKGDKLVGKYYVLFDAKYKEQIKALVSEGQSEDEAKKNAPIMLEAQEMLRKWEQGEADVMRLWKRMNDWVYSGFDKTYDTIGVNFDKLYYESDTYKLGREEVIKGSEADIFYQKEDGSVWVNLEDAGMDHKLLLRADGTAVYITQDIGTAILRLKDFPDLNSVIYTVGNEQDYHFKVLFEVLKRLGYDWAKNCYHLSYGMVDLPSGKMKSREGTVVDADDLAADMKESAREITQELGKLEGLEDKEKEKLYHSIGMGALKYYLLKVDPKKSLLFNPEESIDFQGNTGPFVQYTYARIESILRKADKELSSVNTDLHLTEIEKEILVKLYEYPSVISDAAQNYSPALLANYTYDLVKLYNSFYQSTPILKDDNKILMNLRLVLSNKVAECIKQSLNLMGIDAPEQM